MIRADLPGLDALEAGLERRMQHLARARLATRRVGGPARWRRAEWLWPQFTKGPS